MFRCHECSTPHKDIDKPRDPMDGSHAAFCLTCSNELRARDLHHVSKFDGRGGWWYSLTGWFHIPQQMKATT